jgi:hypothetical protein
MGFPRAQRTAGGIPESRQVATENAEELWEAEKRLWVTVLKF